MTSKASHLQYGDEFLKPLFEGELTFRFRSKPALERILQDIDPRQNEYLIFTDVPSNAFERLSSNESSLLFHRRKLYIYDTKRLIIKMISKPHNTLALRFSVLLLRKIDAIGAGSKFRTVGSADEGMGNVTKQPDGSWGPRHVDYLTGVLEVGLSDSMRKLATVAHLWIEKPESHVHQVVTAKISSAKPKIIFQIWEPASREYQTRSGHPPQARKVAEARVERKNNEVETQGPLHLSYAKIFEESAPTGTPDDIILGPEDLTEIAERVWEEQTFPEPKRECPA